MPPLDHALPSTTFVFLPPGFNDLISSVEVMEALLIPPYSLKGIFSIARNMEKKPSNTSENKNGRIRLAFIKTIAEVGTEIGYLALSGIPITKMRLTYTKP